MKIFTNILPSPLEIRQTSDSSRGLYLSFDETNQLLEKRNDFSNTSFSKDLISIPIEIFLSTANIFSHDHLVTRCIRFLVMQFFSDDALALKLTTDQERLVLVLLIFILKFNTDFDSDPIVSVWKEYVSLLPVTHCLMSLFYDHTYEDQLKGTTIEKALCHRRKKWKSEWEGITMVISSIIHDDQMESYSNDPLTKQLLDNLFNNFTEYNYFLVNCLVTSRTLGWEENDECESIVLIPLIDFANHSFHPNATLKIEPNTKRSVSLILSDDAISGDSQELLISYGQKSNEDLLINYGFAVESNPYDAVMFPVFEDLKDANMMSLWMKANLPIQFFLTMSMIDNDIEDILVMITLSCDSTLVDMATTVDVHHIKQKISPSAFQQGKNRLLDIISLKLSELNNIVTEKTKDELLYSCQIYRQGQAEILTSLHRRLQSFQSLPIE